MQFRLLVRNYGVDLAFSPMVMADSFMHSAGARAADFTTCPADRPLITQLACQSGPQMARCAEDIACLSDGVDLNCGCPQKWAVEEGYGCALLKKPELIEDLVKSARAAVPRWRVPGPRDREEERVPFSVSIKIRLVPTTPRAMGGDSSDQNNVALTGELVSRAARMGVDWVTIHGRTPSMRPGNPARWNDVAEVISGRVPHIECTSAPLPIFLNGDVTSLDDAIKAQEITKCQGVMVARALLKDPTLFDTRRLPKDHYWEVLRGWLDITNENQESLPFGILHRHAYWILERHINKHQRAVLHNIMEMDDLREILRDRDICTPTVEDSN